MEIFSIKISFSLREANKFLSKKLNGENERVKYERLFSLCIPYMRRVKTFLRRWYLRMNRLRK